MTCDVCKQDKQGVVLATDEKGTIAICPDCVKKRFPTSAGTKTTASTRSTLA